MESLPRRAPSTSALSAVDGTVAAYRGEDGSQRIRV